MNVLSRPELRQQRALPWLTVIIGGVPVAVTFCPLCYSASAFDRRIATDEGERTLTFEFRGGLFVDAKTEGRWDVTGRAVAAPLEGAQLRRLPRGDYFAFAWFAFKPETALYSGE